MERLSFLDELPVVFNIDDGFTKETIRVEYEWRPPRCDICNIFGHVHDYCPKKVMSPPIVTTCNVVTLIVEKTNDGFQTGGKKKKRKGKSKSTNGGEDLRVFCFSLFELRVWISFMDNHSNTSKIREKTTRNLGASASGVLCDGSPKASNSSPLIYRNATIIQFVDINTKVTSYARAAGASAKGQPKVNSNFRPLVADPVLMVATSLFLEKLSKSLIATFIGKPVIGKPFVLSMIGGHLGVMYTSDDFQTVGENKKRKGNTSLRTNGDGEEEHVKNVYDELANLFPNTKTSGSSSFTDAVG
nr:zinc knuckle CX2CX4HX4C [Tanacetum cinerariifolium]